MCLRLILIGRKEPSSRRTTFGLGCGGADCFSKVVNIVKVDECLAFPDKRRKSKSSEVFSGQVLRLATRVPELVSVGLLFSMWITLDASKL